MVSFGNRSRSNSNTISMDVETFMNNKSSQPKESLSKNIEKKTRHMSTDRRTKIFQKIGSNPWMSHTTSTKVTDADTPNMMLRAFSPIPSEEIRPLFEFYFKPLNFITNTKKFYDCGVQSVPKE